MWKIETKIIVVLKVQFMCSIFLMTDKNIQAILDSINYAINELDLRYGKRDKIRHIFHILLKVYVLRHSYDIIDLTKRVK